SRDWSSDVCSSDLRGTRNDTDAGAVVQLPPRPPRQPPVHLPWPRLGIFPSDRIPLMSEILVPVSFGELLDKIAILQIKSERIRDPEKLANVRKELEALRSEEQ